MRQIKEHAGKKYLMVVYNILDKVLDKTKEIIDIEKYYETKILISKDDKLEIFLKNAVMLMTSIIKDDNKPYAEMFLQETLYDE